MEVDSDRSVPLPPPKDQGHKGDFAGTYDHTVVADVQSKALVR